MYNTVAYSGVCSTLEGCFIIKFVLSWKKDDVDGLVQECAISSALALEIAQSCTKPLIYYFTAMGIPIQKAIYTETTLGVGKRLPYALRNGKYWILAASWGFYVATNSVSATRFLITMRHFELWNLEWLSSGFLHQWFQSLTQILSIEAILTSSWIIPDIYPTTWSDIYYHSQTILLIVRQVWNILIRNRKF